VRDCAPGKTGRGIADRGGASDLLDVVDVMLATGLRISEVLALRWGDVDLGDQPTLTVSGTLVYLKKKGLLRQPHTKTSSGFRILSLPAFAVEVLLRRSVEAIPTETNAVFPSAKGTWKWPNNYRRTLRAALKEIEGDGQISPHVFRKSVATLIDAEATLEAAAAVLGHSGTAVTAKHYVKKATAAPDMSEILDRFGREPKRKRWVTVGFSTPYPNQNIRTELHHPQVSACNFSGPPSGTRTHTESILSRLPLPIGL
jgi:integrase